MDRLGEDVLSCAALPRSKTLELLCETNTRLFDRSQETDVLPLDIVEVKLRLGADHLCDKSFQPVDFVHDQYFSRLLMTLRGDNGFMVRV